MTGLTNEQVQERIAEGKINIIEPEETREEIIENVENNVEKGE